MDFNHGVICDVKKCRHNYSGSHCTLTTVKVTADEKTKGLCDSYQCSFEE